MQITVQTKNLRNWSGSVLAIGLFEEKVQLQLEVLDGISDPASLAKHLDDKDFSGKTGERVHIQILGDSPKKLVFIGLGDAEKLLLNDLREGAALAARESLDSDGAMGIIFPWERFESSIAAKAVAESIRLSFFKDQRFQSDPKPRKHPVKIDLIGISENIEETFEKVNSICAGVELARELVGAPPNALTPEGLAKKAIEMAKEFKLECKILERKDCEKEGMGAYLAVAKGSDLDPKFIHLIYKPSGQVLRRIALVGKGLTFDSGGYNLKVGASKIEMMKYDMGGSASVLGAARSIGEIAPKGTEIHFIIASCENMVNGSAVHPGDIVQASNGKTIEINNTDAEGRLTLADALTYACKLKPDVIIDLATLTGACVVALGEQIAGLWANNDELAEELKEASRSCGENLWRMPLQSSYKEGLKSMLADIKNTGPRAGGSITAALFLREFIEKDIAWAHIDIAGTCWSDKGFGVNPAGATGYGVQTLVNWVCNQNN